jgi:hypothetical protein
VPDKLILLKGQLDSAWTYGEEGLGKSLFRQVVVVVQTIRAVGWELVEWRTEVAGQRNERKN